MKQTNAGARVSQGALVALAVLAAATAPVAAQAPAAGTSLGIDTTNMDRSVRPQDDFFRFVNGGWLDRTEIPADKSSWGSFQQLADRSDDALKEIVEAAAADATAKPGSETQKVRDYYNAFMDTARIEQLGLSPLQGELDAIAAVSSKEQLPQAFARLRRQFARTPLGAGVGQDQKNSSAYTVYLGQSGLGMPDRDYYLRDDPQFEAVRKAYADYITKLMTLGKQPDPAAAAQRILALETELAKRHWDRVKNRDTEATYNRMSVSELDALMPEFDVKAMLAASDLGASSAVVVRQPTYLPGLDSIIASTPLSTWKDYMTYSLLGAYANDLSSDFVQTEFDFYGTTLSGQQEMEPRWKRGVGAVEGAMGEAVGKLYVAKYFEPAKKARMEQLVHNLLEAYRQGIQELDWMSPATKKAAENKLAHFTVKIGYPDKWKDYSSLDVRAGDLVGNVQRARAWAYDDMVSRLGKPVDRSEWGMTPQTVNAYYNPVNNEIVFPAAILQPPFFNFKADDAVNYGGIVAVIGHEVSHGFDDQGRKYDDAGNLRDWWTPEDAEAFQARTARLDAQYSSYAPLDTLHINGKLTMGENIGDLSGLAMAYKAYHMSLNGKPAPVIDGFTGDQRFFMGWAQVWRTKTRDQALRRQLMTDPHSPGQYRAFIPLTDIDAFYKAFDLKPGDRMYRAPEDRVKIW